MQIDTEGKGGSYFLSFGCKIANAGERSNFGYLLWIFCITFRLACAWDSMKNFTFLGQFPSQISLERVWFPWSDLGSDLLENTPKVSGSQHTWSSSPFGLYPSRIVMRLSHSSISLSRSFACLEANTLHSHWLG